MRVTALTTEKGFLKRGVKDTAGPRWVRNHVFPRQTLRSHGFPVITVHRPLVHFLFLIPVLALCPSRATRGGQSEDNCRLSTQRPCTYCSTVLDLVCVLNICFCSSQTWCLFLPLPFTCEKLINLRCLSSVLRMNTGDEEVRRREVNVNVLPED